ncbi:MAG: hypothetical protein FRX48_07827 [Lasallia pustulata]|uniref:Uncharacterized protein n=1 Tax=Lasallia pustulata TaxID=136370 RepID=A0A5M8PGT5_9LECA|nr:MAG: hypothetical protein FRX48_07827 [Lasallia pustulata]
MAISEVVDVSVQTSKLGLFHPAHYERGLLVPTLEPEVWEEVIKRYDIFGDCAALVVVRWVETGGTWGLTWELPLAVVPPHKEAEIAARQLDAAIAAHCPAPHSPTTRARTPEALTSTAPIAAAPTAAAPYLCPAHLCRPHLCRPRCCGLLLSLTLSL